MKYVIMILSFAGCGANIPVSMPQNAINASQGQSVAIQPVSPSPLGLATPSPTPSVLVDTSAVTETVECVNVGQTHDFYGNVINYVITHITTYYIDSGTSFTCGISDQDTQVVYNVDCGLSAYTYTIWDNQAVNTIDYVIRDDSCYQPVYY